MATAYTNTYAGRYGYVTVEDTGTVSGTSRKVRCTLGTAGGSGWYRVSCFAAYVNGGKYLDQGTVIPTESSTGGFPIDTGSTSTEIWIDMGGYGVAKTITIGVYGGIYYGYDYDTLNTTTLTLAAIPVPYTACSAPSSVWITPTTIGPGSNYVVHWSGARAGTNNPIVGFTVNVADSNHNVNTGNTGSGTLTLTASTTGGTSYAAKVYTRGPIAGYDSDWSSTSSAATVFGIKYNGSWVGPLKLNGTTITSLKLNGTTLY